MKVSNPHNASRQLIILAVFPSSQMMKMDIGMLKYPKSPNILHYKLKRKMIKILDVRL